jgi:hypothetical protein
MVRVAGRIDILSDSNTALFAETYGSPTTSRDALGRILHKTEALGASSVSLRSTL